ncbi:glycosyltransferase family protein [bacterium AH-315-M05]|nr:glycosyltransferase family protein [bacterium AH-315-M05]
MHILAIIQARVGSTRLPGKVLLDMEGKTVLEHVINRVNSSSLISATVVATTINKEDLAIVKLCSEIGSRVFCGSEKDVLDRFYQAAKLLNPEQIIRITADCPLIDSQVVDKIINTHIEKKSDYTSNTLKITYPDGEDVEIFTFKTLKKAWKNARLLSEREHVTPYIRNRPKEFKLGNVEYQEDLSDKIWTLDVLKDYVFITSIYKKLYKQNPLFGMQAILDLLNYHPDIENINAHIKRNEGSRKTLKKDKKIDIKN